MTDLFQQPDDATELSPDDRKALRQTWITTRADLNKAEAQNILNGTAWARRRRRGPAAILDEEFARTLHKQMFGEVWSWAGKYRDVNTNIGVDHYLISTQLPSLFSDARYWLQHKSYETDELATRLHHRLVSIHPFPNGNGRHSREMADLLVDRLGGKPFTWGGGSLMEMSDLRKSYIAALKAADKHDIEPLLRFVRS